MFKNKNVYVNAQKKKVNPVFSGVLCLAIGVSWTVSFYEFRVLREDYLHAIEVVNRISSGKVVVSHDREEAAIHASSTSEQETIDTPAPARELTVEEEIRAIAQENSFADADLLIDIAMCESSLNPQATNAHSSAVGLYQILDMHELTVDERMDVRTSTEWTINKINSGGLDAWNASKHCWS